MTTEQPTPDTARDEPPDAAIDAAVDALQKERGLNLAQAINTALTVLRASGPLLRAQIADEIKAMPRRTGTPEWSKASEVAQAVGYDVGLAAAQAEILYPATRVARGAGRG